MMDVKIVITAAADSAKKGIDSISSSFARLAQSATAAGAAIRQKLNSAVRGFVGNQVVQAFSAQALLGFTSRTLQWADALQALSERLGIGVRELQIFEEAAKRTNTSVEAIAQAMKRLAISKSDAMAGRGTAMQDFLGLGISPSQVQGMTPIQLWQEIGARVGDATSDTEGFAAAIKLLGRGAEQVLPAMRENLVQIADQMERVGKIADERVIGSLADANDQMEAFGGTMRRVMAPLLAMFATGVEGISIALAGDRSKAAEFTDRMVNARVDRSTIAFNAAQEAKLKAKREVVHGGFSTWADYEALLAKDKAAAKSDKAMSSLMSDFKPASADELARIGLFRGGFGANRAERVMLDQLRELRSLVAETRGLRSDVSEE